MIKSKFGKSNPLKDRGRNGERGSVQGPPPQSLRNRAVYLRAWNRSKVLAQQIASQPDASRVMAGPEPILTSR